jgi:hypothetical protein
VLALADFAARQIAEEQIADRVAGVEGVQGQARVDITSFPFLGRLLASGTVDDVSVSLDDVRAERVRFATVAVHLDSVRINRGELLSGRQLVLEDVGRGVARADISQDELSRLIDLPVTLEQGRVGVRVGGQQVAATATVSDNVLRLTVAGTRLPALTIPRLPLVPCVADVELLPGRARLTCTLDRVPPELVGRIQARL